METSVNNAGVRRHASGFLHFHQPLRDSHARRIVHTLKVVPAREESCGSCGKNWTEAIARQSYFPIAAAGVLNSIAFEVSPSLEIDMRALAGDAFREKLVAADRASASSQEGHGGAHATTFTHAILGLERTPFDMMLQSSWGIEHFREMFGHRPEGFWLPEAAVDMRSLEVLAACGIKYVILSPSSARFIRPAGEARLRAVPWDNDVPRIPAMPYKVRLFNGKEIHVFFYDFWLSKQMAFNDALADASGRVLADAVDSRFGYHPFTLTAIDGETLGHHKVYGVSAYSNYLRMAGEMGHTIVGPGRLMDTYTRSGFVGDAEITDGTSWSCFSPPFGRWGGIAGSWKAGLRSALNYLSEQADGFFDKFAGGKLRNVEEAKLDYIHVLLGEIDFKDFIDRQKHGDINLSEQDHLVLSALFDAIFLQQNMFVSCAWFFEDRRYETQLALEAAFDLNRRMKLVAPDWSRIEHEFAAMLAKVVFPGTDEEHTPNAAVSYSRARDRQAAEKARAM